LIPHALGIPFGALLFASIPAKVFWPYFTGVVILAVGIFTYSKEVFQSRGINKLVTLSPIFFAVPMAVFASQHFTETKGVSTLVPRWLPGHIFWTYFIGTAIIAAALGIASKKQARLAAILFAVLLLSFELFLHLPNILVRPRNVIAWAIALRDLSFCAGALAFAGTWTEQQQPASANILVTLARIFLSVSAIFYGIVHFLHPEFMPAVDFDRTMPSWVPAPHFWSYLAGAVFLIAGIGFLVNRKTRLAATALGIFVLVLVLFVYLPILAAKPSDINEGLNFFVSTLAYAGAVLLLARATPADARMSA
jgi:uncharacterized membrane protein